MEFLFSYGTLQQKNVQLENFGRELKGTKDYLTNYVVEEIEITDKRVIKESGKRIHPILKFTGKESDRVEGTVFEITKEDLLRVDDYEVNEYIRIAAILKSGRRCWIYAASSENA